MLIPAGAVFIIFLFILMFFDDMFPRCSCCGKIKPRFFFRLHKNRRLIPGYRGSISVCGTCSSKYDIDSFERLRLVKRARRKAEFEASESMNKHRRLMKL